MLIQFQYRWMKDVEQGNLDIVCSFVYGHTYYERNIAPLKVQVMVQLRQL